MPAREARRIEIELTPAQQAQIAAIRRQILAEEKQELSAVGRQLRAAHRRKQAALADSLRLLKTEREAQGVSLSDMEQRTGIAKSNLSKLENTNEANPTIATLSLLAEALGKRLVVTLIDK